MNVGIIGMGLMGQTFAQRFHSQGHRVSVFNRTADSITELQQSGLLICQSVAELVETSTTIILMVSDAAAIHQVLALDETSGNIMDFEGKTILQMATISPTQSREIGQQLEARNGRYLESPVLGSLPEASTGTLILMAAGSQEVFQQALPVLKVLGENPRYIGDTGTAAALKLAMNQLIAALTAGFSLSLGYAVRQGVDVELFMQTVRESALYAKTYDKKLEKYLSREFGKANFSTRHLLKDIRLFIEDAGKLELDTASLQGIEKITAETVESGFAMIDYSSIFQTIVPEKT